MIITGQHYLNKGHWADAYGWPIDPGAPYETDGTYIRNDEVPKAFTESEVRAMLEDVALIVPGNRPTVLARLITEGLKDREKAA